MSRTRTPDSATQVARTRLLDTVAAEHIGEFVDVRDEESLDNSVSLATYTFESSDPAYPGWYWAVTLASLQGQSEATVSEVNLLPGSLALVPQPWRPWASRVEPGDLGVGDLLAPEPNDPRLTAGFTEVDEVASDAAPLHPVQWELGLGREKILSVEGAQAAVSRWWEGQTGPRAAMAKAAPANCGTCGFMVAVGGSLGQAFGLCANQYGAADGHVVALTFGCGAHSSVRLDEVSAVQVVKLVIDDDSDELEDGSHLPDFVADNEVSDQDDSDGDVSEDDSDDDSSDNDIDVQQDAELDYLEHLEGEASDDLDGSDDDESGSELLDTDSDLVGN
ncbi:MAG: DUF3027 domain-containing protein [Actinobacteria bacterium]|uniref:Unannotated protein n=1 Tax=freshwater metagenome TaxID=449393 RepID=A0A6J5Z4D1_9ZZZZ|nr:DUF3027 domain-containing protein [Actinomycetota bacterium]